MYSMPYKGIICRGLPSWLVMLLPEGTPSPLHLCCLPLSPHLGCHRLRYGPPLWHPGVGSSVWLRGKSCRVFPCAGLTYRGWAYTCLWGRAWTPLSWCEGPGAAWTTQVCLAMLATELNCMVEPGRVCVCSGWLDNAAPPNKENIYIAYTFI